MTQQWNYNIKYFTVSKKTPQKQDIGKKKKKIKTEIYASNTLPLIIAN